MLMEAVTVMGLEGLVNTAKLFIFFPQRFINVFETVTGKGDGTELRHLLVHSSDGHNGQD